MGRYSQPEAVMNRFFADPYSDHQHALLTAEDTAHAGRVLRLGPGDHVETIVGQTRYLSVIEGTDGNRCIVRLAQCLPSTEPQLQLTLFQGIPKGEKMEFILQKATELGVVRIVPVMMSRCIVKLDRKDLSGKHERWAKIVREACKQSGRCIIPEVAYPVALDRALSEMKELESVIVPWEENTGYGPKSFFHDHPDIHSAGIVIGPEGGITPDEIRILQEAGAYPITLGPRILRTETAGIAVVSALFGLYGEMEKHQ